MCHKNCSERSIRPVQWGIRNTVARYSIICVFTFSLLLIDNTNYEILYRYLTAKTRMLCGDYGILQLSLNIGKVLWTWQWFNSVEL